MKTIYNTQTEKAGVFSQPYTVDGKPGTLPEHLIELEVIETPRPETTDTQKVTFEWIADLEAKEYRQTWKVADKTKEELTPRTITKAQGLIQLERMGLYDNLMAMVDTMDKEDRIIFEATKEWELDNRLISAMAVAFGMTEENKMDFFIAANGIQI